MIRLVRTQVWTPKWQYCAICCPFHREQDCRIACSSPESAIWWVWIRLSFSLISKESCHQLAHLSLEKMGAISQTIFSGAFSWVRDVVFSLKFHCCLFIRVQLTITQHLFRLWLGAVSVTSHYLNQCWSDSLTHRCGTKGRGVKAGDLLRW